MSLSMELEKAHEGIQRSVNRESDIFDAVTDGITKNINLINALKIGDKAPGFTLSDQFGRQIYLNDVLKKGPVVISFYRDDWRPYCNLELDFLKRSLPRIRELGATLLAISPQNTDVSRSTAEMLELGFSVLSDDDDGVARQFGLVFNVSAYVQNTFKSIGSHFDINNDIENFSLLVPGTFILDSSGTIRDVFLNADYEQRMESAMNIQVLESLV